MKIAKMIIQISLLYILYLIGTWVQHTFDLFIPGSIIGMLFLFLLLITKVVKQQWIEAGSLLLIKYLPLLFVPVTVGVISFFDLFIGKGIFIIIIVLISTVLVMISTGWISQTLVVKKEKENEFQ